MSIVSNLLNNLQKFPQSSIVLIRIFFGNCTLRFLRARISLPYSTVGNELSFLSSVPMLFLVYVFIRFLLVISVKIYFEYFSDKRVKSLLKIIVLFKNYLHYT